MVGGGRNPRPGEISLAHRGVLFLDEAPEFGREILQALREPAEEGFLTICRAQGQARYPAEFQLVMAANPCPCGNLGRKGRACLCSLEEVERYWRRIGGALMDRIDIRVPVRGGDPPEAPDQRTARIALESLERAWFAQARRYEGKPWSRNARVSPEAMAGLAELPREASLLFIEMAERKGLSTRSRHAILRLSWTLADMGGRDEPMDEDVDQAFFLRSLGDGDPLDAYLECPA
jgi:magnesium chelatase family protein